MREATFREHERRELVQFEMRVRRVPRLGVETGGVQAAYPQTSRDGQPLLLPHLDVRWPTKHPSDYSTTFRPFQSDALICSSTVLSCVVGHVAGVPLRDSAIDGPGPDGIKQPWRKRASCTSI